MLRFIRGRASSGKTYKTIDLAKAAVNSGEKVIILVPEQFSFECEKKVLAALGDSGAQSVAVLSFSRICDEVDRVTGGVCSKPLKESDIHIIMKRAISVCNRELLSFKRFSRLDGFAGKMAQTVYELKINCIEPTDLKTAAEQTKEPDLAAKLNDTALIYDTYNTLITEKYVDPSDKLKILYEKLEGYRFFEGKTVFIDSFDGFTGQQFKIIERIFSQCKDVFISLNLSANKAGEYSVFSNVLSLQEKLTSLAKLNLVAVGEEIVLNKPYYENPSLAAVEEYLYSGNTPTCDLENVTVCRANIVYDEAEFTAREIRKCVRKEGIRYRDIVVIARDIKPYIIPLKNAMQKNGVPLFIDERTPLLQTAAAAVTLAAAELLRGIKSERILKFYKSGLDCFTIEEIGTLENYIYVWDIDDNLWLKKWDMNPEGLVTNVAKTDELDRINLLRIRAITPILKHLKGIKEDAKSIITALMGLLEDTGAVSSLISLYTNRKTNEDETAADIIRQSYDAVISVLDSIYLAYKNEPLTVRDFCEILHSALSLETVGSIPAALDEVTFGAADRIRPARPEYVYILGANQGVFPRAASDIGVFSNTDRSKMIDLGLTIPDRTIYESVNEEYLVYTNVCSAKRRLTISYSSLLPSGEKGEPSAFLSGLVGAFGIKERLEPDIIGCDNLPETPESTLADFCRKWGADRPSADLLYAALCTTVLEKKVKNLVAAADKPCFSLAEQTAAKLFSNKLYMSPSAFDDFSRCRLLYFCKDALKIYPLQKSQFDNLQRGTIVHFVLERAIKEHGKDIAALNDTQIEGLVDSYIEDYLGSVSGFKNVRTPRFNYLINTIARGVKAVLKHMAKEFKNTDFTPVACELKIGDNGDIPALSIPITGDNSLELHGVVDRLDKYNGYLRVIDYKTGTREFKLPDILVGQNMQMLIYLYAVCKSENFGGEPAAVLYMPAKRNRSGDIKDSRMNGVILNEAEVISAMDKSNSGRFIPTPRSKNSFIEKDQFTTIFNYLEKKLTSAAGELYRGNIAANPVNGLDSKACKYCNFSAVCRIEEAQIQTVENMPVGEVIEKIERWEEGER